MKTKAYIDFTPFQINPIGHRAFLLLSSQKGKEKKAHYTETIEKKDAIERV